MKLPDAAGLGATLTERFGVAVDASLGTSEGGSFADFTPTDLHANEGFFVRTTIGWRHVQAQLHTGSFAADLLRELSAANEEQHARFLSFAQLVKGNGGQIAMSINGSAVDALAPGGWPAAWKSLAVSVERGPFLIDHEDASALKDLLLLWGGNLLGMVISLLPVVELPAEVAPEVNGLPEGARERIEVNRYERNRLNRTLCIACQGTRCAVCSFDFASVYGELGRDFIHVHHVVPVSRLGPGYVIDPRRDLVPVCPNCHAMIHRREPPLSVEELRQRMGGPVTAN